MRVAIDRGGEEGNGQWAVGNGEEGGEEGEGWEKTPSGRCASTSPGSPVEATELKV